MSSHRDMRFSRMLLLAGACLSAAVATVCAGCYGMLYWRYRDRFDAQGRYFDAADMVVYHQQSAIWLVPALLSLAMAMALAFAWRRCRRVG
jgi:predicted lysophospholipase L1 biosynthesis ABC-type transport system permease subunit